jgi:hypothetical protein
MCKGLCDPQKEELSDHVMMLIAKLTEKNQSGHKLYAGKI